MQNIEQQLHTLLREIDPKNAFSREEQSKIIAHAASMFKSAHRNLRLANKLDERTIQARMNDAILKAMSSLNEWDDYSEEYIDIKGLSSNQALRKVAEKAKSKWGLQEVLNPDVLDYLDFDLTKDVYTQYYGWNVDQKDTDSHFEKNKNRHKKYRVKVLFKRYY